MSAEQRSVERATDNVGKYVESNLGNGDKDASSKALLSDVNKSVADNTDNTGAPNSAFSKSLEESGVLPNLAMQKFDTIAKADGKDGISKEDLKSIREDKTGKYDATTKLAADFLSRNFKDVTKSDDSAWLKFDNWNPLSNDATIDKDELGRYRADSNEKFVKGDSARDKTQAKSVEKMSASVGDYLNRGGDERTKAGNQLDRDLKDGGFTKTGSEKELNLMRSMERDGTAGKFIKDQLQDELKEGGLLFEDSLSREDLGKIAKDNPSHAKRLAAKLALRNFESINKADIDKDNGTAKALTGKDTGSVLSQWWNNDSETLNLGEIDIYARNSKSSGANVRLDKNSTRTVEKANNVGEAMGDKDANPAHISKLEKESNKAIRRDGTLNEKQSGPERSQSNAVLENLNPGNVANILTHKNGDRDTFKKIAGDDNLISQDEARQAADNKDLSPTDRLAARAMDKNFKAIASNDFDSETVSKYDLEATKRKAKGDKSYSFADMTGKTSDKSESAPSAEKNTSKELAEKVLDEDATGEDRVKAAHELHKNGIKSFQYKVGENGKTETAHIRVAKGKNGVPDALYVAAKDAKGRERPMLRSYIEQNKDGDLEKVYKQGTSSFEGQKWSERVEKGGEADLVEVDKFKSEEKTEKAESKTETDKSKVLEDEDASPKDKLEAIFKKYNNGDKVKIQTEDGKTIEGQVVKGKHGWVGIASEGKFFVKGVMRKDGIQADNKDGHMAQRKWRDQVKKGWKIAS